jgi:AAA family ATP:ADP antiporter
MSQLRGKLLSLFNILPGEGNLVMLVLAYAILLYTANVLARTASYALFLAEYDAQTLPYAYIGVSIFAPLASTVYLKLNQRYSLSSVLIGIHAFLLLTLAAYRLGLGLTEAPWLLFSLPIYFGVNNSLTISSFWNLLGRIYNLQQGKRLFGLLSSGEHLATVATGFIAPVLVSWLGTPNLFLVSALVMALTLGLLIFIFRTNAGPMSTTSDTSHGGSTQKQAGGLLADSYVWLIFSLFALFVVGVYFVDNIFYGQAEARFPTEDELASFIGVFLGAIGVVSLLVQTFVAGRVLSRFGVRAMILATPTGLMITTILFSLVGTFTEWMLVLFWVAVAANFYRMILDAVDNTAVNIMYQPLPAQQRTQVQTTVVGIIYPVAIGFTGLALLFFFNVLHFTPLQVTYVLLLILVVWLTAGVLLGQAYPRRLQQALKQRTLSGISMPQPDRSSLAIFLQGLTSPHVGAVVYSLDMLEEIAPQSMVDCLPDLLEHARPEVRQEALRRIERLGLTDTLEAVAHRLQVETSSSVRAAALRTLAALGESKTIEQVYPYLEDPDPQIRRGALVGLLRSAGAKAAQVAEDRLSQLAASSWSAERLLAAEVIGATEAPHSEQLLGQLLNDEDLQVRRTALTAVGQTHFPQLWALAVAALASRETRRGAAAALVSVGEPVLSILGDAFAQPDQDREVLMQLARICGRIGGDAAISLLRDYMRHPDDGVRPQVLAALKQCGFRVDELEQPMIREQIEQEAAQAVVTLACLVDIGDDPATSLLAEALKNQVTQYQANIFALLSFVYDAQTLLRAWDALRPGAQSSGEQRAYALEAVDVLIARELKRTVLALVGDLSPVDILKSLNDVFPQVSLVRSERLQTLIAEPTAAHRAWIKACTLYTVGMLGLLDDEMVSVIASTFQSDADYPLIIETATWTLTKLERDLPEIGQDVVQRLKLDRYDRERPLVTIEKIVILKKVNIFSQTPDETLVDVAGVLTEVRLGAGETIFEKGDQGDSMYVVVDGRVRVHDGDRTLNILTEGEVFGEMALLDPEPRVAAVTAVEDTRLLRLEQEPFYELVEERMEVARGIIQVLSRRLRDMVHDLAELRAHPEAPQAEPKAIHRPRIKDSYAVQADLSLIEKVIILKTVDILAGTPDSILAEVATLLKDVPLGAGDTIFEKGTPGDCMYIIVSGHVRVHDEGHTLNYLGEGDVFGEMALLDPEPRLASVTATEDTRLLRLDQGPFYELMEDRIEVARGIIRVLSSHLRHRVHDVTELTARLEMAPSQVKDRK